MSEKREPLRCGKCGEIIPSAPGDELDYARIAKILGGSIYCIKCESPRTGMLTGMASRMSGGGQEGK